MARIAAAPSRFVNICAACRGCAKSSAASSRISTSSSAPGSKPISTADHLSKKLVRSLILRSVHDGSDQLVSPPPLVATNDAESGGCLDRLGDAPGYTLDEARSTADAIALAVRHKPSLIVLDLNGRE